MIRSSGHDLYTIEVNKIALSADDDKRQVQEDGVSTLPWGPPGCVEEAEWVTEWRPAVPTMEESEDEVEGLVNVDGEWREAADWH